MIVEASRLVQYHCTVNIRQGEGRGGGSLVGMEEEGTPSRRVREERRAEGHQ